MQIAFNKIPDNLLRPVMQVADIRKARVASRKEREALGLGTNDIILQSPLGMTEYASRDMLYREFRYSNGKKVMLTALKSTAPIVVSRQVQLSAFTMPVRGNIAVILPNGAVVNKDGKKSLHLITYLDQQGKIDRSKVYVVNQEFFKKMFKSIPGYTIPKNSKARKARVKAQRKQIHTEDIKEAINKPKIQEKTQEKVQEKIQEKKTVEARRKTTDTSAKMLKAVAQLVVGDKVVGYIIEDNSGNSRQLDIKQVAFLAKQKRITNIGYSQPSDRKPYIFGIGIKLTDLPKVTV